MYWIALIALVLAAGFDLRSREIPNLVPLGLLVAAVVAKLAGLHPASWGEIALGAGVAFLPTLLLFRSGGLGGGDVKLLTALGATLGFWALLPFAILTGLIGGVVALCARRFGDAEIPYAPVMLAGLLALVPAVRVLG